MNTTQADRVIQLTEQQQILSTREARQHGLAPDLLLSLHQSGKLKQLARGLYTLPHVEFTPEQNLLYVYKRVTKGVVCLMSSLYLHGVIDQAPEVIWLALPESSHMPRVGYPLVRVVRLGSALHAQSVETLTLKGTPVQVYSVARSVTDCFKFRNKIGRDIGPNALKAAWEQGKVTLPDLWREAEANRVANVMRTYLDALTV